MKNLFKFLAPNPATSAPLPPVVPITPTAPVHHAKSPIPFTGHTANQIKSGAIEFLSDADLQRLNELLPWQCFTADTQGRRFGDTAWNGKRDTPQVIPDPRIVLMNQAFNLPGKSVLEVGCFEGIHTTALAQCGATVHAIDSRIENVVKTIVRCNLLGFSPTVSVCDLESSADVSRLPKSDIVHHVGVLYHLKDPVAHLHQLTNLASHGLLLDTHYATPERATSTYSAQGQEYKYHQYKEKGRDEVFSGMYDHAKWLLLDDIKKILSRIGFSDIQIVKEATQRNGPRVTLIASTPSLCQNRAAS